MLATSVRDAQEVVSKVRFEHRAVVADFRLVDGSFKFWHELSAADVVVAAPLVLRPRILAVTGGGEGHADFPRFHQGPNRVQFVAGAHFLDFPDLRLHDQLAVAEFLGNEREAVGGNGIEIILHLSRGGAHRLVNFSLHFLGQNLFPHRIVELRFPLRHRFAVFRFEGFHGTKHLKVVGQASVDLAHDLEVGHLQAVETSIVQQQFFKEHGLEQSTLVVLGDVAAFQPRLRHPVQDVTHQHNFVPHHGHNPVDALVRLLGSWLGQSP